MNKVGVQQTEKCCSTFALHVHVVTSGVSDPNLAAAVWPRRLVLLQNVGESNNHGAVWVCLATRAWASSLEVDGSYAMVPTVVVHWISATTPAAHLDQGFKTTYVARSAREVRSSRTAIEFWLGRAADNPAARNRTRFCRSILQY